MTNTELRTKEPCDFVIRHSDLFRHSEIRHSSLCALMVLFADYEGFVVEILKLFWLAATIPASLLALAGIAAAMWPKPHRLLACLLGGSASVVELIAAALVCLAFWSEYSLSGPKVERFRPGPLFWSASALTIGSGLLAIYLGFTRKPIDGK
jgi:hypothetical protein